MADIIDDIKIEGTADRLFPNIKGDNVPAGAITSDKMGFHIYFYGFILTLEDSQGIEGKAFLNLTTKDRITSITDLENYLEGREYSCTGYFNSSDNLHAEYHLHSIYHDASIFKLGAYKALEDEITELSLSVVDFEVTENTLF